VVGRLRGSDQVELYPVWWNKNGRAISYQGTPALDLPHAGENGWVIEAVTPYRWCGGYVDAAAC
jgi:hypothetical protein